MKVYIVSAGYDHEGLNEPEKVFASRRNAHAYINNQDSDDSRAYYTITELELEN